jgi:hypothetical protein
MAHCCDVEPCFLAKQASEELQRLGKPFVFWAGLFWSPDSRDAIEFPTQEALNAYVWAHPEIKFV